MDWKDTVINRKEKQRLIVERSHQQTVGETQEDRLLQAQAEISFKAGYFEGRGLGIRDGIKEVVEWINKNTHEAQWNSKRWQSQLEVWGV